MILPTLLCMCRQCRAFIWFSSYDVTAALARIDEPEETSVWHLCGNWGRQIQCIIVYDSPSFVTLILYQKSSLRGWLIAVTHPIEMIIFYKGQQNNWNVGLRGAWRDQLVQPLAPRQDLGKLGKLLYISPAYLQMRQPYLRTSTWVL